MTDPVVFVDPDSQAPLADGDLADPDVGAHHDRPCFLVHHHTGDIVRQDRQVFEFCNHFGNRALPRKPNLDRARIQHANGSGPQNRSNSVLDACRRREIRRSECDAQAIELVELEIDLALHDCTVLDTGNSGNAFLNGRGVTLGKEARSYDRTLRHGIDFTVRT